MHPRAARLMTVPASVTLLCTLSLPGSDLGLRVWKPSLPAPVPAPVEAKRLEKMPVPRLVAVCPRIARRVNSLRPTVKARLKRVVGKLSPRVTILVTSAHRTRAEQAALRPTFGIKARPGTSTHEDGRAVDVNVLVDGERISPRVQNRVIGEAMASEGFRYLGPRDPVHYSIPKDEVSTSTPPVADLEVPTWDEMREIVAHNELVEEQEKQIAAAPSLVPAIAQAAVAP